MSQLSSYIQSRIKERKLRQRQLADAWVVKRQNIAKKKLTKLAPAWLTLSEDRTSFNLIPERADVVRQVFRLAIDGMGCRLIAKKFNSEKVPTFAYRKNSKTWHPSYIKKILQNKAVLGHYQPCVGKHGPDRQPIGDVIPDYFPAVIDEATFYKAQHALQARSNGKATGRTGERVANLFAKRMRHAIDGSTITLVNVNGGKGRLMVSSAAQRGEPESQYMSFRYEYFEHGFLRLCRELDPNEFLPEDETDNNALIEAENELAQTEQILATLKKRIASAKDVDTGFETMLDLTTDAQKKLNTLRARVDDLKAKAAESKPSELLSDLRAILDTGSDGEVLHNEQARAKLRTIIQSLVEQIYVVIFDTFVPQYHFPSETLSVRVCKAQIHFKSGKPKFLFCAVSKGGDVCLTDDLGSSDLDSRTFCDIRTDEFALTSAYEFREIYEKQIEKRIAKSSATDLAGVRDVPVTTHPNQDLLEDFQDDSGSYSD
jgi:hypothetical protein